MLALHALRLHRSAVFPAFTRDAAAPASARRARVTFRARSAERYGNFLRLGE